MAISFELNAEPRTDTGKGASRRLRHAGKVPAIAAKLLSISNGLQSAPMSPITRLDESVMRLGARKVSKLLTGYALQQTFQPSNEEQRLLWRHAIQTADWCSNIRSGPVSQPRHVGQLAAQQHGIYENVLENSQDIITDALRASAPFYHDSGGG